MKKLLIGLCVALLPAPALAQTRLEAEAYARARAQCGYDYQAQMQRRCPANAGQCTAPLLEQQGRCLRRAEQSYHRSLQRLLRPRDY